MPQKSSGERLDKLDYEGESSDEECRLGDEDIRLLVNALKKNSVFKGPLDLHKNNLSDLVSYLFLIS